MKHQSCKECRRDFVGTDLNIGENLCEECDGMLHEGCRAQIIILDNEVEELKDKIASIRSLFDNMVIYSVEDNKNMKRKLEERTVALRTAIGMAQESILPSPNMYNKWRVLLGWTPGGESLFNDE